MVNLPLTSKTMGGPFPRGHRQRRDSGCSGERERRARERERREMEVQQRGLVRVVVAMAGGGRRWPVAGGCGGSGCSGERERGEGVVGAGAGKKGSRNLNPK